jgi:hypothetical protein
MPIQVEVPGHGIVEFPDGMTDDQIASAIQANMPQEQGGFLDGAENFIKGGLKSAQNISQTLMTPVNRIIDLAQGNEGGTFANRNAADFDQALGANQDSTSFSAGKLFGDIALTTPIGGVLGGAAKALGATKLGNAISSGGFNLGDTSGNAILNALTRTIGGGVQGAAAAGAVNPEDVGTGAAIGAAIPGVAKGAYTVGKAATSGAKSLVEPFYASGREQIIGRALRGVAGNQADDATRNLQNAAPLVPGSQPTAGMVAGSPGVAALERAAIANNPVATNELAIRQAGNNEARQALLDSIIPDRQAAQAARTNATEALYSQSSQAPVKMTEELVALLQRPSMQAAVTRASKLAEESGEALDLNNLTGRTAQYIKMALDDMANSSPMTGIGGNELRSLQATRQAYLDELGKQIPEYLQANKQYAELSRPITQADVLEKVKSGATNFRGDLTPAAFNRLASDRTAQTVTGRNNALSDVLDPEQLQALESIKQDLLNQDFSQTAGRGVGSNTVQNLAYSNILEGFGVPTGLSQLPILGAVGNIGRRVGDVAYKSANERLAAELAEILLNPQQAGGAMQKAIPSQINPAILEAMGVGASRTIPVLSTQR